ncbi:MAG: T9SS type A sorting domain-containing protein [Paludibacteraceae bacterium]|nr:T9SS type A sorting domain-containing protein [Paludibacteraceae bacterium]
MLCENQYTITDEEAILFSGKVGNKRLGKKLYKHIKKIKNISFDKIDIPASLYDGRNPNIGFDDMNEALQNDPKFFIYSGEGAVIHDNSNSAILTTGISNPYRIIPNNFSCNEIPFNHIGDINNYSATIFPMSFGFSCKLNTFCTNKNFGAEWIGNINGGVTFYSSTTDTKFTPNLRLSKKIFKKLKQFINKKDNFPISTWLYCSEQAYYNALMTSVRRNQIKRYNLLGDPTLHINGISSNTEENIYYSSQSKKVSDKDNINIKIKQIYVYDITGRLINIYIDKNIDDILSNISKGIYLVKILYTNDTIETIKFIN